MRRPIAFSDLISPLPRKEFFEDVQGKTSVYFSGRRRKFAQVFSWEEFNQLLNMTTVWSDATMKLVLDGREVTPSEFCQPVRGRDGNKVLQPDPKRLTMFLEQGATVVLDLAERLTGGLAAIADVLQTALGAPVSCNIYCSWEQHRGFPSHFDTMDVFALQIEGEKIWRLYDGRFHNPVEQPGYNYSSLPRHHHDKAKGNLLEQVVMTPGDVLYIPRGQYHDALASKSASLHLSFGVTEATGQDFVTMLANSLIDDPLFRAALPHFDDSSAHSAHLNRLASRLGELFVKNETAEEIRTHQKRRAFRHFQPGFSLPHRQGPLIYRVRVLGVTVDEDAAARTIVHGTNRSSYTGAAAGVIDWVRERDFFSRADLEQAFPVASEDELAELLDELKTAGLIDLI